VIPSIFNARFISAVTRNAVRTGRQTAGLAVRGSLLPVRAAPCYAIAYFIL